MFEPLAIAGKSFGQTPLFMLPLAAIFQCADRTKLGAFRIKKDFRSNRSWALCPRSTGKGIFSRISKKIVNM
jgi:hypothetical protein